MPFSRFLILTLVFTTILPLCSISQTVTLTDNANDLTVCGAAGSFSVDITNNNAGTISGVTFTVALFPGLEYVPGSVSGGTFTGQIADSLFLSLANIPAGQTQNVQFSLEAPCQATTSGSATMDYIVTYNTGSQTIASNPFLVKRPSLSLPSFTNQTFAGDPGVTFERCVNIFNGGQGELDSFSVFIVRDGSELFYSGFSLGATGPSLTPTVSGDTLKFEFTGSNFTSVGDMDALFELGESFDLCYDVQSLTCFLSSPSTFTVYWGCNGDTCQIQTRTANVTGGNKAPAISMQDRTRENRCYGTGVTEVEVVVRNLGTGLARNIILSPYNGGGGATAASIDTSSVTWHPQGGTPISLHPDSVQDHIGSPLLACLGPNPIRRMFLTIPEIQAGSRDTLRYLIDDCCKTWCDDDPFFASRVFLPFSYQDSCLVNSYNGFNGLVQRNAGRILGLTAQPPSLVFDGDTFQVSITHPNWELFKGVTGQYLIAELILPTGIDYLGGTSNIYFEDPSANLFLPSGVVQNGDTLRATFPLPVPSGFGLPNSNLNVNLVVDCNDPCDGGVVGIDYRILQVPDPSCSCEAVLACFSFDQIVDCGICNNNGNSGAALTSFEVRRTNYGLPDNDDNGLPDPTGNLDFNLVRTDQLMFGDTLQTQMKIKILPDSLTGLNQGQVTLALENGGYLTLLQYSVEVYDSVTGNRYTMAVPAPLVTPSGNDNTYQFDFNTLAPSNAPVGFQFEQGDSITFTAEYRLSTNIGTILLVNLASCEMSISNGAGGLAEVGPAYRIFRDIGYSYNRFGFSFIDVFACSATPSGEDYRFALGNCCATAGGGNAFPFEYRNWATASQVRIIPPPGIVLSDVELLYTRTTGSNQSQVHTIPMEPDTIMGDTLIYTAMLDSMQQNGGSIPAGDDDFGSFVSYRMTPNCEALPDTNAPIVYMIDWDVIPQLQTTGAANPYRRTWENVELKAPRLDLTALLPVVPAIQPSVQVAFQLRNPAATGAADSVWVSFRSPSGLISISAIRDLSTGQYLSQSNGVFATDRLEIDSTRILEATVEYFNCNLDSIELLAGWDCRGRPFNPDSLTCTPASAMVYIDPQPSLLQGNLTLSPGPFDICDSLDITLDLNNAQLGYLENIELEVYLPIGGGATYIPGSSALQYPLTSAMGGVADPTISGTVLSWEFNQLNANLAADAFPGTSEPDSNQLSFRFRIALDCDLVSGSQVVAVVRSDKSCGEPFPRLIYLSPSIEVNGVTDPYTTQVRADVLSTDPCNRATSMRVSVVNNGGGLTIPGDSVEVLVGPGYQYQGNFISISNAPVIQTPNSSLVQGGTKFAWALPPGLLVGDSVVFEFDLLGGSDPGCMSELFEVRSVYPASPFCSLTGLFCNTAGQSGSDIDFFDFQRPDLNFASYSTFWNPNAGQVDLSYQGIISASSGQINAGTTTTIGFYCDQDGSMDLTIGDSLLHTYTTTQAISPTSPHFFSGMFSFPDSACPATSGILAVIFPDTATGYCICDTVEAIGASLLDGESLTLRGSVQESGNYLSWKGIEGTGEYQLQRWVNDWTTLNYKQGMEGEEMGFTDLVPSSREIYRVMLRRPTGQSLHSNLIELVRGEEVVPSVVPNPFSETLGVRNAMGYTFEIRNVMGQVVLSGPIDSPSHQIGTERLPGGSYVLYLQKGQSSSIHKLIRQ